MSFNDLERGIGSINDQRYYYGAISPLGGEDSQYRYLSKNISQQVFEIISNVVSIQRLINYIGTVKDTPEIRSKL
ncbi:31331_t:CDS:2 [Gigaspora margarita]|uniref:31331_t:CDS:1 n=1 Tax=Gigaspora margarita TaxID=4874 RepID=A0ABN7UMG0_GIGMA|nr:31331_t:CDS:2 [Gigaspora margarita]